MAATDQTEATVDSDQVSDVSADFVGISDTSVTESEDQETDTTEKVDEPVAQEVSVIVENAPAPEAPKDKKDWYILKVQVNREDRVKENLVRRVKLAGLDEYFDEILVPTEKISVVKSGKKKVTKRKLYPGYLMVRMEINDDTWFLVRETTGIGDFTGAGGKPVPMLPHEVQQILQSEKSETEEAPKLKIPYEIGDRVKIIDGTFKDVEGEVHLIDENTGRITVNITIFARTAPVELEYWQVEKTED